MKKVFLGLVFILVGIASYAQVTNPIRIFKDSQGALIVKYASNTGWYSLVDDKTVMVYYQDNSPNHVFIQTRRYTHKLLPTQVLKEDGTVYDSNIATIQATLVTALGATAVGPLPTGAATAANQATQAAYLSTIATNTTPSLFRVKPITSSGTTPITINTNIAYWIDIAPEAGATYTITSDGVTSAITGDYSFNDGKGNKLDTFVITPVTGTIKVKYLYKP